jgi:hypothetical protein
MYNCIDKAHLSKEEGEIIIEGIFDSCDANATSLILLEAVILRVHGDDPYNPLARTELIRRAEKASVNMAEVKEVRFSGINITKDGIQLLQTKPTPSLEVSKDQLSPSPQKEPAQIKVEIPQK